MRDGVVALNGIAAVRYPPRSIYLAPTAGRFVAFDEMQPRIAGFLRVRDA